MMRNLFVLRSALVLAALPALAQERPDSVLVLADDGALDAPAVHAIRNTALAELRKRGISVAEDRRTDGVRPIDSALASVAYELGARRIFALRVGGRLGQKVPLSLEELMPGTLAPVYTASLTAMGLEECDVVTARLVEAVVSRRSADSTAEMRTVTASESKPFAKKPGERFWFIGLPVALYNGGRGTPYGFSLSYGYEAEFFRISVSGAAYGRDTENVGFVVMEAAWIPFATEVSPYLGGGVGYMGAASNGGIGAVAEAGIEAFRLHGVRMLAGAQLAIPFFDTTRTILGNPSSGRNVFPAAFLRFAF